MRTLTLAVLVLAPALAHAQTTDFAPYVGMWAISIRDSPLGTIPGTLSVAADGTGALSMPSLMVVDEPLTGVQLTDDGLAGTSAFDSPVVGNPLTCAMTLAPAPAGALAGAALAGTFDCGPAGSFAMSASRPNPDGASLEKTSPDE